MSQSLECSCDNTDKSPYLGTLILAEETNDINNDDDDNE